MRRLLVLLMVVALGVLTPLPAIADSVSSAQTFFVSLPGNATTLRGTVALTISSDQTGGYYPACGSRSNADLFVDGQFSATTTTAECSGESWVMNLDTTAWPNGEHAVSVSNADLDAQIGDGKDHHANNQVPIKVIVANNAPSVDLTSPGIDGAWLLKNTFLIRAQASPDPNGSPSISRVDFLVDGSVVGSAASPPYQFPWNTRLSSNGNHNVSAVAYDGDGHAGASLSPTVLVRNVDIKVRLTANHPIVRAGKLIVLTATATDSHGAPMVGLRMNLYTKKHVSKTWTEFYGEDTGANGQTTWNEGPDSNYDYKVVVDPAQGYDPAQSPVLAVRTFIDIHLKAQAAPVKVGQQAVIKVTLLPGHSHQPLDVQIHSSTGWHSIGHIDSRDRKRGQSWSTTYIGITSGRKALWHVRVVRMADHFFIASYSEVASVRVV